MAEMRKCLVCNKSIKGRSDKKFCNNICRNIYNNRARTGSTPYIRSVNDHLKENHQILEEMLQNAVESIIVSKEKLQRAGFSFQYHTHTYTTRKGSTYCFCYDHGYLLLDNGNYLIVKEKRENPAGNSNHKVIKTKVPEQGVNTRPVPAQ